MSSPTTNTATDTPPLTLAHLKQAADRLKREFDRPLLEFMYSRALEYKEPDEVYCVDKNVVDSFTPKDSVTVVMLPYPEDIGID